MCRWKRHEREGRLEFEVHSEWMRRTRRIGQVRPADAEGSKARQGVWVWVWVLGPGSSPSAAGSASLWHLEWEGGHVGRLGIRWGHLDQSNSQDPTRVLCPLCRYHVPGYLPSEDAVCRVASEPTTPCNSIS